MKQYYFGLITVVLTCLSSTFLSAQTIVSLNNLQVHWSGTKRVYITRQDKKPLDGKFKIIESRRKEIVASFSSGKINGDYKEFIDGRLQVEGQYQDGSKHGHWREYFPSNKLKRELHYSLGQINGEEKTYYTNSRIERQVKYINGQKDGVENTYNQQGELIRQYHWVKGEKDGSFLECTDIDQRESSHIVGSYKSGKLHGPWKCDIIGPEGKKYQIFRLYEKGEILEEKQISNE